jgi:hypothetical protein
VGYPPWRKGSKRKSPGESKKKFPGKSSCVGESKLSRQHTHPHPEHHTQEASKAEHGAPQCLDVYSLLYSTLIYNIDLNDKSFILKPLNKLS